MIKHRTPLAVIVIGAAIVTLLVLVWRESRTYRLTIAPGQETTLRIETRMQRVLEHKSFAKQRGLPVACELTPLSPPAEGSAISVSVSETGHRLQYMWADIHVQADDGVIPGVYKKYAADFTIDGHGGWPRSWVVVRVQQ